VPYTTPEDVRDLIGLDPEDAPDNILEDFIEKAQYVVLHHIQTSVRDEVVTLDTTGNTFSVKNPFIADTNFDEAINSLDVHVYGWVDSSNPISKAELTISTILPDYGFIVITGGTVNLSYEQVTVDYSYYTCDLDWNLLEMATAYYAGMLYVAKEECLVPEDVVIGNIRLRDRRSRSWQRLREEFDRLIFHITAVPIDLVKYRKMVLSPREERRFAGPGTTYEIEERSASKYIKDIE